MSVVAVIDGLSAERERLSTYVLRTLLTTLGLHYEIVAKPAADLAGKILIWYGPRPAPVAARATVEIASFPPPTPDAVPRSIVRDEDRRRIAVLGPVRAVRGKTLCHDAVSGAPVVAIEGSHAQIGLDLVATAGFWLTGRDEESARRDALERVEGATLPRAAGGLLRTPVVTDLMTLLCDALRRAADAAGLPLDRAPAWPSGRDFAVLLSHDVDLWRKRTVRQAAKELLRTIGHPLRFGSVARAFLRGPDPWSDLAGIAALEERRGMHSTFFALAGRPDLQVGGVHVVNSYRAAPAEVGATLRAVAERGCEIALHGSFDSFRSAEALASERRDLASLSGQPVLGCRQHFLRFDRPATWRAQIGAGLAYDATLGYHDLDGYRAGFSFPFRPFDGEELPILVLPLVLMDGALRERQGLDAEAAWRVVESYLERTRADGALLSLLWHNHYFCGLDAPGYRGVYERALDWIRDHHGWGASAREISDWWIHRASSQYKSS